MKHAKKMRYIPDEEYQQLIANKSELVKPLDSNELYMTDKVENNMHNNSKTYAEMGDDERWKLYQQALHRMLDISEIVKNKAVKVKFDNFLPELAPAEKDSISPILSMFPRNQQEKAALIKNFLEKSDQIHWDENDGQVFMNGHLVQGSHIANLISHVIKPLNPKPSGCDMFIKILSSLNIPTTLIGNASIKNSINKQRTLEQNTSPKRSPKSLASNKLDLQSTSSSHPSLKNTVQQNGEGRSTQNGSGWKNKSKPVSKKVQSFRWKKFK